ncbi:MAG: type II toxin-antitoxin system VapC family toxin [Candidatus Heimdallarchaeota archaeon]
MVSNLILVDTGVIAAFYNRRDEHHSRALELLNNLRQGKYGTGILTDYVLDETVTLLYVRSNRADIALHAGNIIITEKLGTFFPMTFDLIIKTWETYQKLIDKGLSFTDCSLLAVAEYLECNDILSFAKEFDGLINRIS